MNGRTGWAGIGLAVVVSAAVVATAGSAFAFVPSVELLATGAQIPTDAVKATLFATADDGSVPDDLAGTVPPAPRKHRSRTQS